MISVGSINLPLLLLPSVLFSVHHFPNLFRLTGKKKKKKEKVERGEKASPWAALIRKDSVAVNVYAGDRHPPTGAHCLGNIWACMFVFNFSPVYSSRKRPEFYYQKSDNIYLGKIWFLKYFLLLLRNRPLVYYTHGTIPHYIFPVYFL